MCKIPFHEKKFQFVKPRTKRDFAILDINRINSMLCKTWLGFTQRTKSLKSISKNSFLKQSYSYVFIVVTHLTWQNLTRNKTKREVSKFSQYSQSFWVRSHSRCIRCSSLGKTETLQTLVKNKVLKIWQFSNWKKE